VGFLPDKDDADVGFHMREDGSWVVDSMYRFDELCRALEMSPPNVDVAYTSVGGFFIHHSKRVPKVGETFSYNGYKFEIIDMDHHRIDKLLVQKDHHEL
jgi:putative hemolysin